jgi:hypothetical protein
MTPTGSLAGARRRVHRLLRPMAKSVERVAVNRLSVSPARLERMRSAVVGPSGSPLVRVTGVTLHAPDGVTAAIDRPVAGTRESVHALRIAGSVLGQTIPAATVEVLHQGRVVATAAVSRTRDDLARRFPEIPHAATSGFLFSVGTVGFPASFQIELRVILEDKSRVPIATIDGDRDLVRTTVAGMLRPIMVTTLGRSGGTWLMRLLSEQPGIVVHREHPYELLTARYWLDLFKVLSDPADHLQSASLTTFLQNPNWVGRNPFYPDALASSPDLNGWFGRDHVEDLAEFSRQTIDSFYRRVAVAQGQSAPVYFAEKFQEDHTPLLGWELFPDAREIFLVRDFRDVATSKLAFHAKRNRRGGDETAEGGLIRRLDDRRVRHLLDSWTSRSERAHLVRYEDLIRQPDETLASLLGYLDLDASPAAIKGLIERASKDTPDLKKHRTSESPEASIGRWRRDLSPELQAACETAFGDALATFGYER